MKIKRVVFAMSIVLPLMATASCGQESLTKGDRVAFERWCDDLPGGISYAYCQATLRNIEAAIEEDGWSKDCATQWYKDKTRGRKPDPYRCE